MNTFVNPKLIESDAWCNTSNCAVRMRQEDKVSVGNLYSEYTVIVQTLYIADIYVSEQENI